MCLDSDFLPYVFKHLKLSHKKTTKYHPIYLSNIRNVIIHKQNNLITKMSFCNNLNVSLFFH